MNPKAKILYDLYRAEAPRRGVNTYTTDYWRGRDFPNMLNRCPPKSTATYGAWLAGRDAAQSE